jgi:amino acid permease
VTGWSYWLAYTIGVASQLIAAANIMDFWPATRNINPAAWITIFFIPPLLFNNFNVRRYGEFEYWLTVIKIVTVVGLIVLGIFLPLNASPSERLLRTVLLDNTTSAVEGTTVYLNSTSSDLLLPCPSNATGLNFTCVGTPGFGCKNPAQSLL